MNEQRQDQPDLKKIFKEYQEQYPDIKDYSAYDADFIVELFGQQIKMDQQNAAPKDYRKMETSLKSCYYGGITNNIPQNLSRHHIDKYIFCAFVDSFDTAREVEKAMDDKLGIFIGVRGKDSAGMVGKMRIGLMIPVWCILPI